MKRLMIALCAAIAACAFSWADSPTLGDQEITYKVMYKWGLINKRAGTVNISLLNQNDNYECLLTARTEPWADGMYKLRDTLTCTIRRQGFVPLLYIKSAHEDKTYEHNVVAYSRQDSVTYANCSTYRVKKGKVTRNEAQVLEGQGTCLDMFSAYFYMRLLPFGEWEPGHTVSFDIFSGRRKELLTIKYLGTETIKIDNTKYECYSIAFLFTVDGKTKSQDDMLAWITTGTERVPVKLEGKLPIGSVRCLITDK